MKMFRDALRGIALCIRNERNIRIHIILGVVAIITAAAIQLNMGIILLVISSVLSSEMLNTSIESICNFVHSDENEEVRNIKDIAAGAVLINVVVSVLVGAYLCITLGR